jgi:allophanate hydrolase
MSATVQARDVSAAVTRAFERVAAVERPEVWIELRSEEATLEDARRVEERLAAGEELPLAGQTVAVKDNIDVAGLPTTAGCPAFAYSPVVDAPAVAALKAAGAIILGKTSMDQFATGLVGTRSPYGAVRDAHDPARVSGGSSSGSAVAVALDLVDLSLGTDTAGSGRVPAAFQGIVGLKPTRGLVSVRGVVPACRSFDCVSVLARDVVDAERALAAIAAPDPADPLSRAFPPDAPQAAPPNPRIATARPEQLEHLSPAFADAFAATRDRFAELGAELVEIDLTALLDAGALLYGGAFVAERYAAVGEFIAAHRDEVDPSVAEIILAAGHIGAAHYLADLERLGQLRLRARAALTDSDALLLPTAPFQPTIGAVAASPVELNRTLGSYTTFCNMLDMCAVAVPAGSADGGCFGVTLLAPAFHDRVAVDLALRFAGAEPPTATVGAEQTVQLLVVGAHMTGEPLNPELIERGGRRLGEVRTTPNYRLYRLATEPPKPGLVRQDAFEHDAASIEGELWSLPLAGLASLVSLLPPPMTVGPVTLEGGRQVTGFLCEPAAVTDAQDITKFRGWRSYLEM